MVFKEQRLQRLIHSKVMVDKHMSRMTGFVSFINISQSVFCISGLYARILIQYFCSVSMYHCTDLRLNNLFHTIICPEQSE